MKLKRIIAPAILLSTFLLISPKVGANSKIDGPNITMRVNETTKKENQIKIDSINDKKEKLKMLNSLPIDDIASWSDFNASEYGIVTPVITQGQKNTCWAHSIAAASETSILKEGLHDMDTYLRVGADNIAYQGFNRISKNDPLGNASADVYESNYDRGNQISKGVERLTSWNGIHLVDSDFLYSDEAFYTPDYLLEESITINSRDILDIKRAISEYGGVTMFYNYSPYQDNFFNPIPNTNETHAVEIIGWDDNIDPNLFGVGPTPKKAGGWLCKNSWGDSYGTNGLFYLSYDAILNDVIALDYMKYDSKLLNYYYDGFTEDNAYTLDKGAVIFEAKGEDDYNDEYLESINVKLSGTKLHVKADIYINPSVEPSNRLSTINNPASGTHALSASWELDRGGSRMLKLPKPIKLNRGDYYSIIISVSGDNSGIIMSKEDFSYNDLSYYYDNGSYRSTFYNNNGVVRIKGITRLKEKEAPSVSNNIKYAKIFKDRDYIMPGDGIYTIKPEISYNGRKLYENLDYILTYSEDISLPSDLSKRGINIGRGIITITGINDFLGSATKLYYTIILGDVPDFSAVGDYSIYSTYDIEVDSSMKKLSDIPLPDGFRWTRGNDAVVLNENINGAIEYVGPDKDRYKFTIRDAYLIEAKGNRIDLSNAKIEGLEGEYSYNGSYIRPDFIVSLDGNILSRDDYRIEYLNNINIGECRIIIRGKNSYKGSLEASFKIVKAKSYVSNLEYIDDKPSAITSFLEPSFKYFTDSSLKAEVSKLIPGESYYLVGYQAGSDAFSEAISTPLKITYMKDSKRSLSSFIVNGDYIYNGSEIKPNISVYNDLDSLITLNEDYKIEFDRVVKDAGIYKFNIIGLNRYAGMSLSGDFEIKKDVNTILDLKYTNGAISAGSKYGSVRVEYYDSNNIKLDGIPKEPGIYIAVGISEGSSNYSSASKRLEFEIIDNEEINYVINIKTKTKGLLLNKMPHIIIKNSIGDVLYDEFLYTDDQKSLRLDIKLVKGEYDIYLDFNNSDGLIFNKVTKIGLANGAYPYDKEELYPNVTISVDGKLLGIEDEVSSDINYNKGDIIHNLKYIDSRSNETKYISDILDEGKYALIVVFKVGCPYGERALRALNRLELEYKNQLAIIASSNKVFGIDDSFYSSYPNLIFTEGYSNNFYKHFNNDGKLSSPTFILIDSDGFFVDRLEGGSKSDEKMEATIRRLLDSYIDKSTLYEVSLDSYDYIYTGSEIKPIVNFYINGILSSSDSLAISYTNNINVGKGLIKISDSSIGLFKEIEFNIIRANNSIYDFKVISGIPSAKSLFGNVSFKYYDSNNNELSKMPILPGSYIIKAYVEATANYNYIEESLSYNIAYRTIDSSDIKIDNDSFIYDGSSKIPNIEIITNGKRLDLDLDYTLILPSDIINAGSKEIIIKGLGLYSFSYSINYEIIKANNEISLSIKDGKIEASALAGEVIIKYYSDKDCLNEIEKPILPGSYYIRAYTEGSDNYNALEGDVVEYVIEGSSNTTNIIIITITVILLGSLASIGIYLAIRKRR